MNVIAAAETISRPKAKEVIFANSHFEIITAHFDFYPLRIILILFIYLKKNK